MSFVEKLGLRRRLSAASPEAAPKPLSSKPQPPNAAKAVAIAALAYDGNKAELIRHAKTLGYTSAYVEKTPNQQACILANKEEIIVAFDGSDFKKAGHYYLNIDHRPTCHPFGGSVHTGFYARLQENLSAGDEQSLEKQVFEQIEEAEKKYPAADIRFVGHSSGGALAVLQAAHLAKEKPEWVPKVKSIITFGQPRVGDKDFCEAFAQTYNGKYHRYVVRGDFIPSLPPEHGLYDYSHAGVVHTLPPPKGFVGPTTWTERSKAARQAKALKEKPLHHRAGAAVADAGMEALDWFAGSHMIGAYLERFAREIADSDRAFILDMAAAEARHRKLTKHIAPFQSEAKTYLQHFIALYDAMDGMFPLSLREGGIEEYRHRLGEILESFDTDPEASTRSFGYIAGHIKKLLRPLTRDGYGDKFKPLKLFASWVEKEAVSPLSIEKQALLLGNLLTQTMAASSSLDPECREQLAYYGALMKSLVEEQSSTHTAYHVRKQILALARGVAGVVSPDTDNGPEYALNTRLVADTIASKTLDAEMEQIKLLARAIIKKGEAVERAEAELPMRAGRSR